MITVEIRGCLLVWGCRAYSIERSDIKRGWEKFLTLRELKQYYGISKLTKTGETEWAIGSKKRYEWPVYSAEISEDFLIKQEKRNERN